LWVVNGNPVSMASTPRHTNNAIIVGTVFTPLEYRRNGYAADLVATLSQKLLDEGFEKCILFADLDNPTPQKIYNKVGFILLSLFLELEFVN